MGGASWRCGRWQGVQARPKLLFSLTDAATGASRAFALGCRLAASGFPPGSKAMLPQKIDEVVQTLGGIEPVSLGVKYCPTLC